MFKANNSNTYIPAKSLSVKPEAQVPYGVGGSGNLLNQIKFNVPQYLGFIDPRETYLKFKLTMEGRGNPKPDPRGGAHSLIRDIVIQDGTGSTTLEEIQDYNALVNTWWDYTANQSINDKRDMYEGRSNSKDPDAQLYYAAREDWTAAAVETNNEHLTPELLLPLKTGIFGGGKVFPVVATKGLRVSLNLVNVASSLVYNDGNLGMENDLLPTTGNGYFSSAGAKANPADQKAAADSEFNILVKNPTEGGAGDRGVNANRLPYDNNPFEVGDRLYISLANGTSEASLGIITQFAAGAGNDLQVSYCPDRPIGQSLGAPTAYPVDSRIFIKTADRVNGLVYGALTDTPAKFRVNNTPWGYRIEDLELICSVVSPPGEYVNRLMKQMSSGQGLNMDIKTYHTYRHNSNMLNGYTTQLIPATEQRAYSIISVPVYNQGLRLNTDHSFKGGTAGLRNYQYVFGGKLIPDRPIDLTRYSNGSNNVEALHLNELEKTLNNCGYVVRDLSKVPEHFFIGRAFSKYGQVFNLKERDLSLRVELDGAPANTERTYYHFVCHLRRLVIGPNGVQVIW
tara:strand:- start:4489 stop:6189 length:1701 start_codon:yes stop_codon:yes gene_type:complete